ncbi:hypothetical protein CHS0354_026452 [Potamilus streckersoni]|uniref:Uncharacterized protein n=1 Tax=Potamilus streckersoni TaxID=2493646 RepID=A0AAE0VGL0_9BIVA|nr:hypothetical protein CHS0354_026452 [Potamilus streckersoni]
MEKNEVFKRNVLKRLYGDDINVTPGNDFDATDIPESIIKQGQRLLTGRQQGDVSTTAVKIYTVSRAPAGYTLEKRKVTWEKTNEGDSHSGSEDLGEERRVKKHRRRGKIFRSNEVKSRLEIEGESDNQTQTDETEKQITTRDQSGLTKNQKRKLKKKKRKEREKMQSALQRQEFVYTEANKKEEKEDNKVEKERTPVLRAMKCEDILRFLFAVWEVYKTEYQVKKDFMKIQQEEPLMLEIEAFLKEEENTKELENMYHIKSVLLLGDQNAVSQALKAWRFLSDLQTDCQELIEGLSKYWLNVMMNR